MKRRLTRGVLGGSQYLGCPPELPELCDCGQIHYPL